jgi:hypothetical protein
VVIRRRVALSFGAALAVLGSLLPWNYHYYIGGVTPTNGVRFYLKPYGWSCIGPAIEDYGGLGIILLSLTLVALGFVAPRFVKRPAVWRLICAFVLAFLSIYHLAKCYSLVPEHYIYDGMVTVGVGVELVLVGSMVILLTILAEILRERRVS